MFSEDIGVYESLIFGNPPWKLHRTGVCIGGWQWHHSASDRTPSFIEPQICAGGFKDVIWLRLDAKIIDKHKAWQAASLICLSECYRVFQMAPIKLDSITMLGMKLLAGHTRSISSPILRGRNFWLTAYSILYEKICCLWEIKILCTPPCGIPRLLPTPYYARPPRR